jgi:chromosome segregation ATPase
MTSLLKNLLGNRSQDRELTDELRAALSEMQQERARYESLLGSVRASMQRLQELGEPLAKTGNDVAAVIAQVGELERRLEGVSRSAALVQSLDERATSMAQDQEQASTLVAQVARDSQEIRATMEELAQKVDLAVDLKQNLTSFLEVDKPFSALRGEAEALRGHVDSTGEYLARLREQNDRLVDAHKLAMSKMEALDRRRDELGRDLQDKERRVTSVELAARGVDGIQQTVSEVRREMGALKTMADLLAQKTASLEAQREAVDRALAQAESLDRAMRQIDAGLRQQQENETSLNALHEKLAVVRSIHEGVVDRSSEIAQLQREIDERAQAARQELAAVADETRTSVERFDFERRGIESVTQRVADLRAALSDCESRFKGLGESKVAVRELDERTQQLAVQARNLTAETATASEELARLQGLRSSVEETGRDARDLAARMSQVAEVRPAVESALRDLHELAGAHAGVRDALEQLRLAQDEMAKIRESQSETRTWLASVEQSVAALREQAGELRTLAPTIEFVQAQTQRIHESMSTVESKREYLEDLSRRTADLETLNSQLDERGQQLVARMESAEQNFTGLGRHAEAAERMTMTIASVSSGLSEARRDAGELKKALASIEERAESVEALAEQTRAMKKELDQRRHALTEASQELAQAATLREEAATSAGQLEELTQRLAAALATADKRATRVDELSRNLEERAVGLRAVEKRLDAFADRMTRWEQVDQSVSRSLEDIAKREDTLGSVKADLERMFALADETATHVREITAAHRDIEGSRTLLQEVAGQLADVRDQAGSLDERQRQMSKAEERLARAEGLLTDVRSSIDQLQGQKAIVDQAVEKASALQFLLKQADAVIEGLREERKTVGRVRSAVASARKRDHGDEGDEEVARAA